MDATNATEKTMCCRLHEEPPLVEEDDLVRLAPALSVEEANDSCLVLLDYGIRSRVVLERMPVSAGAGLRIPTVFVHPEDFQRARMILQNSPRNVLPFATLVRL